VSGVLNYVMLQVSETVTPKLSMEFTFCPNDTLVSGIQACNYNIRKIDDFYANGVFSFPCRDRNDNIISHIYLGSHKNKRQYGKCQDYQPEQRCKKGEFSASLKTGRRIFESKWKNSILSYFNSLNEPMVFVKTLNYMVKLPSARHFWTFWDNVLYSNLPGSNGAHV